MKICTNITEIKRLNNVVLSSTNEASITLETALKAISPCSALLLGYKAIQMLSLPAAIHWPRL